MGGFIFKLSLKDTGAGKAVQQLAENIERPQKMLQEIGVVMLSSVQQNFQEQGRPIPWVPSRRAIEQHGQTLRDTGRLMNSITMKVYENSVSVGTNVSYAGLMHFGGIVVSGKHIGWRILKPGTKKTFTKRSVFLKAGTKIPARPFLMLQSEDIETIKQIGYDYLIPVQGIS